MLLKKYIIKLIDICLFKSRVIKIEKDVRKIILSGSPRSGTTFLAELVSDFLDDAPIIWEPLLDEQISRYQLKCSIRPISKDLEFNSYLQKYLKTILTESHLDYYNTRFRERLYRKKLYRNQSHYLIYKFVRANGLVNNFKDYIHTDDLIMGIVRNPYSVISSQLNHHEFQGHPAFSNYTTYNCTINDIRNNVPDSIERDLAITWCVDYWNLINSEVKVWIFEDLITDPNELFKFLINNDFSGNTSDVNPNKKSTTFIGEAHETDFIYKYKRYLSDEQQTTIAKVLEAFSINYPTEVYAR